MTRLLSSGEADVGISNLPVDHAPLVCDVIGSWILSCVFPSGHRFEREAAVSAAEVLKERLIAFSPDTPQGRMVTDSYPGVMQRNKVFRVRNPNFPGSAIEQVFVERVRSELAG